MFTIRYPATALLTAALFVPLGLCLSGCAPRAEAAPRPVTPRGDLTAEERSNIEVFDAWKGSVVFITTSSRVRDFWTRDVMSVPRGTGSGFVWDEQGHIVTNLHVIANAAGATVKLADGCDYPASLASKSGAKASTCSCRHGSRPASRFPVCRCAANGRDSLANG